MTSFRSIFHGSRQPEKEKGSRAEGGLPRKDMNMLNMAKTSPNGKVDQGKPTAPKTIASRVDLVSPEGARFLRDTAHFERQRNISANNIARLSAEMRAGRFTPGTQIFICVLPDDSEVIVNGNHTLEAICSAGVSIPLTLTRKRVADLDEAGRIYAVFDIQKVRTWRDSLRATGQGEDIPMADKVLAAVGVIEEKFGAGPRATSRLERIERLADYREPAELLAIALHNAPRESSQYLKRASVTAVALETLRYQPSLASEFWSKIAQDDGLKLGEPQRALLQWLRNTKSDGYLARIAHCRASALAWNAAFRGEERTYLKPNAMSAFFLLGTPWAHGTGEG